MTKKEALLNGFTHHGSYYGIPLWINPNNDFVVATKWLPMEYVMDLVHVIEYIVQDVFYSDIDHFFSFNIGKEIT